MAGDEAAERPHVHAMPVGNAPASLSGASRIPAGMGGAIRPKSIFEGPLGAQSEVRLVPVRLMGTPQMGAIPPTPAASPPQPPPQPAMGHRARVFARARLGQDAEPDGGPVQISRVIQREVPPVHFSPEEARLLADALKSAISDSELALEEGIDGACRPLDAANLAEARRIQAALDKFASAPEEARRTGAGDTMPSSPEEIGIMELTLDCQNVYQLVTETKGRSGALVALAGVVVIGGLIFLLG